MTVRRSWGSASPSSVVFEALGWLGSALLLAAFGLVSAGRWDPRGRANLGANALGALFLARNAFAHEAWPVVALETAWGAIAMVTLAVGRVRRR